MKLFTFMVIFTLISGFSIGGVESNFSRTTDEFQSARLPPTFITNNAITRAKNLLDHTPRVFTENRGQLQNDEVQFYVQSSGMWFTNDGVYFEVRDELTMTSRESRVESPESGLTTKDWRLTTNEYKRVILKQEFIGANLVRPLGKERLSWNSNFFYGNDSTKWCTEVPNYNVVYYKNIYDGIDLRYYANEKGLKYDLIVHPGADPEQIRIRWEGADRLEINNLGEVIIKTKFGYIKDSKLFIYQDFTGSRQQVTGAFKIYDEMEYGFEILDDYCIHEQLIIDPDVDLGYSTYLGGAGSDEGYGIAVNSLGNAYVTGRTISNDFPTTNGSYSESHNSSYDIFVTMLDLTGSNLVYSTYVGSSTIDYGIDIAINSTGCAFVAGETLSQDFPTTSNKYSGDTNSGGFSVVIFQLSSNGSELKYSTYVGGTGNHDHVTSIAIDSSNNMYVAGHTSSFTFPTTPGAFDSSNNDYDDGFIFKLNHSGSKLDYCTLLGDSEGDHCHDIAIDSTGNAYITGYTRSPNFPKSTGANDTTFNGNSDCFIFKLNPTGTNMVYSTFLGGSDVDIGYGIVIDSMGNAYVTGSTKSADFPNTTTAFDQDYNDKYDEEDVFITKLDQNANNLIFSTYIGGEWEDIGRDIAIDLVGNVYVTGETNSQDFPITIDAFDNQDNAYEAFLLQLAGNGSTVMYSTYLGGISWDYGLSIELDKFGNAYLTGYTHSNDFPTSEGAFNRSYGGDSEGFVAKFSFKPFIYISSISFCKDNELITQAYTRLCPYTFKVIIVDTVSKTDLKNVLLNLDPLGSDIKVLWNRSTGQFSKLSDFNEYITLDPSSRANNLCGLWTIDFNLTFNWHYPDEELLDVQTYATSVTLPTAWLNVSKLFKVENDLIFNGSLIVRREDNKIINMNEIVKGGEKLTFSGLTVKYENTTDCYPPSTEFNVTIIDDDDVEKTVSPDTGEPFIIELITPNTTFQSNYDYEIRITEIPVICDKSDVNFSIRIDAEDITFSEMIPASDVWHITKEVLVGITISDTGGGEVNCSTVMHSLSTNNGIIWESWELVPNLESSQSIVVKDTVTFKEGRNNLIKWRASDSVGNGPTESQASIISVDTENVDFSNAWPMSSDVSHTEKVEVGITIYDETSGVDGSSVEYSISYDKGKAWSPWGRVIGLNDNETVNVQAELEFVNGSSNRLKWRAYDVAGNGPLESDTYIINVNSWKPPIIPKINLTSPLNALTINETMVNLTWNLENPRIKNVTYDIFFDTRNPPGLYKLEVKNTTIKLEDLKDDTTYYWQVISYVNRDERNSYKSEVWWFKVELVETDINKIYDIKITGPEFIIMKPGDNHTISLTIMNLGNTEDMIDLKFEAGNITKYISSNDYSILRLSSGGQDIRTFNIILPLDAKSGRYEIVISALSLESEQKVEAKHVIILEVQKIYGGQQQDPNELYNLVLFGILGIIISIIVIFLIFIIFKRKKDKDEKLTIDKTITTRPLPPQIISIDETAKQPTLQQPQHPTQKITPIDRAPQPQLTPQSLSTIPQQPTMVQPPVTVSQQPVSPITPKVSTQVPHVVQVAQTPRLPPAQDQNSKPEIKPKQEK